MGATVTPAEYRQAQAAAMSERDLQDQVVVLAKVFGWLCFHPYYSQRSTPGFPDLTLARNGRLIFAELKTEKGQLTDAQKNWLDQLSHCIRGDVDVYVWRPTDLLLGDIAEVLR